MALKRCKQCGILKPVDAFRQYTYSKTRELDGRYRICRECESINSSYNKAIKQLTQLGITDHSDESLSKLVCCTNDIKSKAAEIIMRVRSLYTLLESQGHTVPKVGSRNKSLTSEASQSQTEKSIDKLMAFYGAGDATPKASTQGSTIDPDVPMDEIPEDLRDWLDGDMNVWVEKNLSPEYLQDMVYESLKAKYRPQIGFDRDKGLPIYDDTYKVILNAILRRFDEYEEVMADG